MWYNINAMAYSITKEKLNSVGLYILEGLSEREACILSDISYIDLQDLKENQSIVRDFIEKKHIEFKHAHLKEIQKHKSEKNSQWMLEKLRPDEFGTKGKNPDAPVNIISMIINQIQNEDQGIVRDTRYTRAVSESEVKDDQPTKLRVANILG